MDRYVPLSKKSKKEQKKFHDMQRSTWNGLNPATATLWILLSPAIKPPEPEKE